MVGGQTGLMGCAMTTVLATPALFEVTAHKIDQLLRRLRLLRVRLNVWIDHVKPDMVLEDLRHEAVERAPRV